MRKYWVWALLPVLFALDRAAKIWADGVLRACPGGAMPLIPGLIRFRLAENQGAAFSLFAGNRWLLLGVTSLIMLAVLLFMLFGRGGALVNVALTMVLAGGLGNLYDRFVQGFVIDYLEFLFVRFAIFNLADVFVCVGAVLAAVALYRAEFSKSQKDVERA